MACDGSDGVRRLRGAPVRSADATPCRGNHRQRRSMRRSPSSGMPTPLHSTCWGWNTGRFIDWRWAGNAVRNPDSGWFAEHGIIFRGADRIMAISVAEYGECRCLHPHLDEDPAAVAEIIPILAERHHARGDALSLEFSEDAEWLRSLCAAAGMTEETNVGYEWEYDLSSPSGRPTTPRAGSRSPRWPRPGTPHMTESPSASVRPSPRRPIRRWSSGAWRRARCMTPD